MAAEITHIVDTCALIAYFKGEEGRDNFATILADETNNLAIHSINLCEIYYCYLRSDGGEIADQAFTKTTEMLAVVELINHQFLKRVGRWKVEHNLGLGDCFAAATTEEYGCILISTDHGDFDEISESGEIELHWLR